MRYLFIDCHPTQIRKSTIFLKLPLHTNTCAIHIFFEDNLLLRNYSIDIFLQYHQINPSSQPRQVQLFHSGFQSVIITKIFHLKTYKINTLYKITNVAVFDNLIHFVNLCKKTKKTNKHSPRFLAGNLLKASSQLLYLKYAVPIKSL